MTLTFDLEGYF